MEEKSTEFKSISSSPLFSTIIAINILILLYFPAHFLEIIFSPVLIVAGILLLCILRLGAIQGTQKELSPTQRPQQQQEQEQQTRAYNHDNHIWDSCDTNSGSGYERNPFYAYSFVEWNVGAPLEIIYEGEEENVSDDRNDDVLNDKQEKGGVLGIERYPSLSLYYPESDSDSSSDGDFAVIGNWGSPERVEEISCPVRNLTKRDRKCQEEFSVSDVIKCGSWNLDLYKKVDLITRGINEKDKTPSAHGKKQHESLKQKVNSSGIQNPVSSSCLPRSPGLHNEFSGDDELDGEEPRNCEPVIGNVQLPPSCDSVAMKSSVAQNEDLPSSDSLHINDTLTKCNSMIVEPSKCLKINHNDVCSSKIVSDVGKVEVLSLENEILWETTSHGSVSQKDSSSLQSWNLDRGEHSTISSPMEIVDAFSSDASQQMQNSPKKENIYALNRKLPPAVKGNQGRGVSVNTSTSEVINTNQDAIARRTRRRKV